MHGGATEWKDIEAKIRTAVQNGEMTREQTAERLEGFRDWGKSRKTDVVTDSQ